MRSGSARLRSLFDALIRAETEVWSDVDAEMVAVCGVPLSRFEPMSVMDATPDCRVADIADALSITRGGASKLVERIRADGLCERLANPDDGRSWFFVLTPAGVEVLAGARAAFDAALDRRLGDRLGPAEVDQAERLLRALRRGPADEREERTR
ncbi:MarR family winged helix-turn-helix transcriptional regulator [Curtobacterium pusillum]|uniref:MarR family winged helix-turn-helix transcriptional regulator n=1 Tax=Curtobacterium pusillum TaxID=69373 RepID=UPI0011A1F751|nr:MarR family winged helix-turn-helix transcriptional regulator [Curtobacterium pusillum]